MSELTGMTLLLTRAEGDADAWANEIERRGGRALHLPCITVEPIADPTTKGMLHGALQDCDWLALTSVRGVRYTAELLDGGLPDRVRVAAVGEATRDAAILLLSRCDLVPHEGTGAALAHALLGVIEAQGDPAKTRVLAASADRAERHLEEVLEPAGVWVSRVPVYRTSPVPPRAVRRDISSFGVDTILLASPSAARGLVNQVSLSPDVRVLSIGPTTTRACHELGLDVVEAEHPDLDSLLELLS